MSLPNAPADTPPSPKGRRRREAILDAAEALLIEEGAAGLSMRRLAEQLAIRLSNVQYYFPTPHAVIEALFERALASARTALEADVADDLQSVVEYALGSQDSAANCRLFWELWALSARDAAVAQTLSRFYAAYRDAIEQCVQRLLPTLNPAARRRRAIMIMSLLEGLSLFRGHGRGGSGIGPALDRDVQAAVAVIARMA